MQGLERGFAILHAFSADAPALSIAQMAARAKVTRAVARRYLLTLEQLGYVRREGPLFMPAATLLDLGARYLSTLSLLDVVRPRLESIAYRMERSATVAVLEGTECVYVARAAALPTPTTDLAVGSRLPAHATALGKVLLASLTPGEFDAYLRRASLERFTLRTICEPARLRKAVNEVRDCGWACADEEYNVGLRAIAAPIFGPNGRVAAAINVTATAPLVSIQEMREQYLPLLLEGAREISSALGAIARTASVAGARALRPGRSAPQPAFAAGRSAQPAFVTRRSSPLSLRRRNSPARVVPWPVPATSRQP